MNRSEQLLAWYDAERRDLPWRDTSNPYHVLVSEVMAQQTQISRVVPYYERFITRFPTPESLAAAPLGDVLALWSGLGYNSRAVRLRDAARLVAEQGWPDTPAGLQQLPGVGPYTAAAVACFAFGVPVAAVDTNLRRVLSRWSGRELSVREATTVAATEIDVNRGADWNQVMMDLGARLCSPRNPTCRECPVASDCADPSVYSPPPRQGRFEGSAREARGSVLKQLVASGTATTEELATGSIVDRSRLEAALVDLQSEGMVTADRERWSIAT